MTELPFVEIILPPAFDVQTVEERCSFFQNELSKSGELSQALDLECEPPERLASVCELAVVDVTVADDRIRVDYEICFEKFRACADAVDFWRYRRSAQGIRNGLHCRFPRPDSIPERSTADEL